MLSFAQALLIHPGGNEIEQDHTMPLMRLQKFLSSAGVCSRRKGEEFIKGGRVRVNGELVLKLGTKIDPAADRVEVDGCRIGADQPMVYIALNKPVGYVTSCEQKGADIVLDLIDLPMRLIPIGRLDKDSSGLLLLTNHGALHHQLSHPSFNHEKEYLVTTGKPVKDAELQHLEQGVILKEKKTRPAKITRISGNHFKIVLKEGRNRQIRRMVGKIGNTVIRLKRIRISNIKLGNLPAGSWRHLTQGEAAGLLRFLGNNSS